MEGSYAPLFLSFITSPERESLFAKNLELFSKVGGSRYDSLDIELAKEYRDYSYVSASSKQWELSVESSILLPRVLPNSEESFNKIKNSANKYDNVISIERFLDIPGDDPHLFKNIVGVRNAVTATGFDPNVQLTTADCVKPHNIVLIGTGCGIEILSILRLYSAYHLFVALPSWEHFVSSFWIVDWDNISKKYSVEPKHKLTIGRYDSGDCLLPVIADECLLGIDHSIIYTPSSPDQSIKNFSSCLSQQKVSNLVNYLGFTLDEYNMMVNSVRMLSSQPKVFAKPLNSLKIPAIVCGSGPSLDNLLGSIKKLSDSHIIIASGSNFRTLRANNIRVDIVVIMERNMKWELYEETIQKYGSTNTRLLASVTCPVEFRTVFNDSAIFFRPALTPLSVFSNSTDEILNFEGPQSINSGISFAASIGCPNILLAGVDLGTTNVSKTRSDNASGIDDRDYEIIEKGNFSEAIYTSKSLVDSKMQVENLIKMYDTLNFLNASDGLYIEGTISCSIDDYILEFCGKESFNEVNDFYQWWSSLHIYNTRRFSSSWVSRNPRLAISNFFTEMYSLLDTISEEPFFPNIIMNLHKLLALNGTPANQFPRRLTRGCLFKTFLAISRQLTVMGRYPALQVKFLQECKTVVRASLDELENELYLLCDYIETKLN